MLYLFIGDERRSDGVIVTMQPYISPCVYSRVADKFNKMSFMSLRAIKMIVILLKYN